MMPIVLNKFSCSLCYGFSALQKVERQSEKAVLRHVLQIGVLSAFVLLCLVALPPARLGSLCCSVVLLRWHAFGQGSVPFVICWLLRFGMIMLTRHRYCTSRQGSLVLLPVCVRSLLSGTRVDFSRTVLYSNSARLCEFFM